MHVISVSDSGELLWVQAPNLVPGPAEILIDVKATAINRADLMQRKGLYPPPLGHRTRWVWSVRASWLRWATL